MFMQNSARYTYKTAINTETTHKYALKTHKNGGYVSAYGARGDDSEVRKTIKHSNINSSSH